MSAPRNQAAWLDKAGEPLRVGDAPMPEAGNGEIVVKNAAIAINPIDWHMQDNGIFVKQWPSILGCDIAGEVYEVGAGVTRFSKGDRVIGHAINLVTGQPSDGAFTQYTVLRADKAAILPDNVSFTDGAVVPFAVEAAASALCGKEPGPCIPGVMTPTLGLPIPQAEQAPTSVTKCLVIYGASSSVGAMSTQIATASGVTVIAVAGAHNHDMVKRCGAAKVFDHKDSALVEKITNAVKATDSEFVGVFDAISTSDTYTTDLAILEKLGDGQLACSHVPPKENAPDNVQTGMMFAVTDLAKPLFEDFVTPALRSGKLQCLPPPTVIGKGLGSINEGLKKSKAGVSGTKLVVEL